MPTSENTPSPQPSIQPTVGVSRYVIFFTLAIAGCALDLWTKHAVFQADAQFPLIERPGKPPLRIYWLIENYVGFETSLNHGALFGLGQGGTPVFAGFSVLAAIGIVYWLFIRKAASDLWLTIALGSVTAGIFGNLYDRLGMYHGFGHWDKGAVRDWILLTAGSYDLRWPNFNIADSFLVCGAALLLIHAFMQPAGEKASQSPANHPPQQEV
ncbi:signal peptidase II [Blastopirellula sp. JC732]|uniref:Lipoprotein signal peptidase n=1 Tax=Blastopirellula sediminis TaxID=2894196 RepID=A0A9X1MUE3_9BACT|nr:signal peptidase II [Blastopirellula sediminis]MCC9604911.1 signal peptidase II [Blastopirellula sediminis]MCC9631789.1 signal peptidase II [Blastopirellula sediminis]